jgi:hypothetical protein
MMIKQAWRSLRQACYVIVVVLMIPIPLERGGTECRGMKKEVYGKRESFISPHG